MNKKKSLILLMYINIVVFFAVTILMCALVFPNQTGLYAMGSIGYKMSSIELSEIIIYWICSLPLFVAVPIAITTTHKYQKESQLTIVINQRISLIGFLFLSSSVVFSISNLVFTILVNSFSYEIVYVLVGILGIVFSITVLILQHHESELIKMNEENEGII